MARTELSNSKSICVLAVVVCCFAILWPKIFLPMFQTALQMSSGGDDGRRKDSSVYPPKVREAMRLSRPEDFTRRPARTFQREPKRPENEVPKTGGLMGLVMPIYTIGIIVFFLYTMLKMVFKGKSDGDEETGEDEPKSLLTKLAIDPEHRKFVLHDQYDDEGRPIKREVKTKCNSKTSRNIKSGLKTEKAVKSFGKENVSKALHILIREMEEFKSKMADVERMRHNIKRIESEENSGNKKCCNGSEV